MYTHIYTETERQRQREITIIHIQTYIYIYITKYLLFNPPKTLVRRRCRPATFLKKESPTEGFSCEYCEIFKNSFL